MTEKPEAKRDSFNYWQATGKQDYKYIGDPTDVPTTISFVYWHETTPFFWIVISLPWYAYLCICTEASGYMAGTKPNAALNKFHCTIINMLEGYEPLGILTEDAPKHIEKTNRLYPFIENGASMLFSRDPVDCSRWTPMQIIISDQHKGKGVIHGLLDTLTDTVGIRIEVDNLEYDDQDVKTKLTSFGDMINFICLKI